MPLGLRNVPTQLIVLTNNFSSELLISFHMGSFPWLSQVLVK